MTSSAKRITSIDTLRAFALFGILMVHTVQLYNFDNIHNSFPYFTQADSTLRSIVLFLFEGKCRTIFSILFGISFYLILRNPQYTQKKFCWRCLLLIAFGLLNKFVYTTDILVWYGINGLLLAILPIRQLRPKHLLLLSLALFAIGFQPFLNFRSMFSPSIDISLRYLASNSAVDIITYPYNLILKGDIHIFWSEGTETLAYFVFGYFLGRGGYVENFHRAITPKVILCIIVVFLASWVVYKWSNYHPKCHQLLNVTSAILYGTIIIYLHNFVGKNLHALQCFGKLGLTNYSLQNLLMPLIICIIALPYRLPLSAIVLLALTFYGLQVAFSILWLRHSKYGPWEHLWRHFTNKVN